MRALKRREGCLSRLNCCKKDKKAALDLGGQEYEKFEIYKSRISKFFILEMTLLLISPVPNVSYFIPFTYHIGDENKEVILEQCYADYVLAFMFIRVYFLLKWLFN